MSAGNGVIRVGRKGRKKFAIGEDGEPFEVDVVVAFQRWVCIDDEFRSESEDSSIPIQELSRYHARAVDFVRELAANPMSSRGDVLDITTAEALEFIARLREQYEEVATFFRVKSPVEPDSPATSAPAMQFSAEPN